MQSLRPWFYTHDIVRSSCIVNFSTCSISISICLYENYEDYSEEQPIITVYLESLPKLEFPLKNYVVLDEC